MAEVAIRWPALASTTLRTEALIANYQAFGIGASGQEEVAPESGGNGYLVLYSEYLILPLGQLTCCKE